MSVGKHTVEHAILGVEDTSSLDGRYVNVTGDTMTGALIVDTGSTGQSSFSAGLIVNNDSGSDATNDFQVNSDTLTAIFVDSSANTLSIGVDTTFSDGKYLAVDKVRARDGDGLYLVDDGNNGIFVKDGGNVGIGTTSPGSRLQLDTGAAATKGLIVKGYAAQSANLQEWQNSAGTLQAFIAPSGQIQSGVGTGDTSYQMYVRANRSSTLSGTVYGNRFETTYSPSSDSTASVYNTQFIIGPSGSNNLGSGTISGAYYLIQNGNTNVSSSHQLSGMTAAVSQNSTGKIGIMYGGTFDSSAYSSGPVSQVIGINSSAGASGSQAISKLVGVSASASPSASSSSVVTSMYGIDIWRFANLSTAGATVGTAYGMYLSSYGNVGTITTYYGIYLSDGIGATNNYGIRIGDMSGAATNNYAIYTNAGAVRFGDKVMFTQTDGNEYIDSLADGYMDYGATTQHRFDNDIDVTGNVEADTYTVGGAAGADASFSILDGDGVTSHDFVFTKGLLTSYSTS